MSRPEGDRIVQLQKPIDDLWSDIVPEQDYLVVATDFIYRGGDGYDFSNAREVSRPGSELIYLVLDVVIQPRIAMLAPGEVSCFGPAGI